MGFDAKKESEMFDQAADYYDLYRPRYPEGLIKEFVKETKLTKDSKTLEIGAGSGKATEQLKEYGFDIRCIEVGENLVRRGMEKFRSDSNIHYECLRFENMPEDEKRYDAIFAAQSFHWIPQPIGYEKCARLLKPGAYLAPFWNMYVYDSRKEHEELIELSKRYHGFADFLTFSQAEERITRISNDIEQSGLFFAPKVSRFLWQKEYTVEEYCGFVQTANSFIHLSEKDKQQAYQEIAKLFGKYGGTMTILYQSVLYVAQVK